MISLGRARENTKTKKLVQLLTVVLLSLFLLLGIPSPALAITDPDDYGVNQVNVYRDLLETGDMGFLVDIVVDYAAVPAETITQSFLVVLVHTDGVTQLRQVAPYTFQNSGYDRNSAWIYFSAADAATLTWGAAYTVHLIGNPTLAWPGDPPERSSPIDEWYALSGQLNNRTALANALLVLGDTLEMAWGTPYDMVESTTAGVKLTTTYGENYFLNVIPNARTIAPDAFAVTELQPTLDTIEYSTTYSTTLTNRPLGSPLDVTGLSTNLGTSRVMLSSIVWLIGSVALLARSVKYLGIKLVPVFSVVLVIGGTLLGMLAPALAWGLGIASSLLLLFMILYKPSSA